MTDENRGAAGETRDSVCEQAVNWSFITTITVIYSGICFVLTMARLFISKALLCISQMARFMSCFIALRVDR